VSDSLLYYIANNSEEKSAGRSNVRVTGQILPVTQNVLNQKRYAKACIKESLRLFPIAVAILRTMQMDVCIGRYKIPAEVRDVFLYFYLLCIIYYVQFNPITN